ncbi:MAG: XRE family transcriptional regulator [Oligoflexia bacterium]|nr:XRE family transcriptional regulator [Oligoflexia bacterium]
MKTKRFKNISELASKLGLSEEMALIAEIKAKLTKNIILSIKKQNLTHEQISKLSGVPRTAITGIITGSLQKVTIDRLIRLNHAIGIKVSVITKKAA